MGSLLLRTGQTSRGGGTKKRERLDCGRAPARVWVWIYGEGSGTTGVFGAGGQDEERAGEGDGGEPNSGGGSSGGDRGGCKPG